MTKYVAITTISTFKHRYVIAVDDLQKFNESVDIKGREIEWAMDCVSCNDAEDFSQEHIGELIIDGQIISEKKMLQLFDQDNDYLKNWSKEQKLQFVRKTIAK